MSEYFNLDLEYELIDTNNARPTRGVAPPPVYIMRGYNNNTQLYETWKAASPTDTPPTIGLVNIVVVMIV